MMSANGVKPYAIEAGDELRLDTRTGSFMLLKPSGGFVNLNECVLGAAKENHRLVLKRYDASSFMVLCDLLASSHGLVCVGIRPGDDGNTYVCRLANVLNT
jgi:hypothetical protein